MTKNKARNILKCQLVATANDGKRTDWRKRNYIEALQEGIEALTTCIAWEQSTAAAAQFQETASGLEAPKEYYNRIIKSLNGEEDT